MVAKHRGVRLCAFVLALCLMIGFAASASAAVMGALPAGGVVGQADVSEATGAQPKYTTRLAPPKRLELKVGEITRVKLKFKYKIVPDPIICALDREDRVACVVVNDNLFVFGKDNGTTVLTLSSGVIMTTTNITVKDMPVTGITLSGNALKMNQYEAFNLNTAVIPNSEFRNVKWSTDAKSVASLTNGVLSARKPGTAVITAKTRKGGKLVGSVLVIVS
ncbi:MAG: hypothetical protein VB067_00740 [Christensenellaceae bacterium]|nr:hypothetical protein [Christensenellaceae bacterium]